MNQYSRWGPSAGIARWETVALMMGNRPDYFALARIDEDPGAQLEGYSEPVETEKKILRDVFARGDAWMRTWDLMRRDAHVFYAFVDRIRDTFRRKGENVATLEVSLVIQACPGSGKRSSMAWRSPAPKAALTGSSILNRVAAPLNRESTLQFPTELHFSTG